MENLLMLGALPLVVWLLFVWLRVPVTALFLSIYVGHLISVELSDEALSFITNYFESLNYSYVQTAVLILPAIVTVLILRNKTPKSKVFIEAIPNLFAAVTVVLFADHYLGLTGDLSFSQKEALETYRSFIVSIGAVLSLASAWAMLSIKHHAKKGKH